ncbi:MAG: hypothetical protein PVSMB10_14750 [Pseudarthrobacter sp.]
MTLSRCPANRVRLGEVVAYPWGAAAGLVVLAVVTGCVPVVGGVSVGGFSSGVVRGFWVWWLEGGEFREVTRVGC